MAHSSSSSSHKHLKRHQNSNPSPSPGSCCPISLISPSSCNNHSPSAALDLIILVLVLFSCAFLVASTLSHLIRSLSQTLTITNAILAASPLHYLIVALILILSPLFILIAKSARICSRKCANPRCKGLAKALEFDVQIQTEDCLREKGKAWKEIEGLPWKGGQHGRNPDYEVLRAELRKMAPANGRAVLLFRARCGCPLAKLEAWGPKRVHRQKRSMTNMALEGPNGRRL